MWNGKLVILSAVGLGEGSSGDGSLDGLAVGLASVEGLEAVEVGTRAHADDPITAPASRNARRNFNPLARDPTLSGQEV